MANHNILIFERDEIELCEVKSKLSNAGYNVKSTIALDQLISIKADLVLLNIDNPLLNGIEILRRIKAFDRTEIVILLARNESVEVAVEAMKLGAYDFLLKPVNPDRLLSIVRDALADRSLQKSLTKEKQPSIKCEFGEIVGESQKIKEVFSLIEKASGSDVTVMITGESGTGKELVAKAIHFNSTKKNKPFVAVNCAAIPETLLESELFGHEEGAFTGAIKKTAGRFEQADTGTIFLDEIGEMSLATQVKTLRVLQEKAFDRLGGTDKLKVDVRIISSTNKNIEKSIKDGTFREDLFYRISVFPIVMPPLRERKDDIPLIVAHFLKMYSKKAKKEIHNISREAINILMEYNWPGNVRELENVIERSIVLTKGDQIDSSDIPQALRNFYEKGIGNTEYTAGDISPGIIRSLREEERLILQRAFDILGGNISRVAKELEISRRTLYRKIKEFGLGKEADIN